MTTSLTTRELDYSHGSGTVIPAGTVIEEPARYSVVCDNGYESRYRGWAKLGTSRVFVSSIPLNALEKT